MMEVLVDWEGCISFAVNMMEGGSKDSCFVVLVKPAEVMGRMLKRSDGVCWVGSFALAGY